MQVETAAVRPCGSTLRTRTPRLGRRPVHADPARVVICAGGMQVRGSRAIYDRSRLAGPLTPPQSAAWSGVGATARLAARGADARLPGRASPWSDLPSHLLCTPTEE